MSQAERKENVSTYSQTFDAESMEADQVLGNAVTMIVLFETDGASDEIIGLVGRR